MPLEVARAGEIPEGTMKRVKTFGEDVPLSNVCVTIEGGSVLLESR